MIVLFHVITALCSIVAASLTAIFPSASRLRASGMLIGLTLLSGTYLVVQLHAPLLQACTSGLLYLAITLSGVAVARYRLATAK